jgi:alpha-D-xyloside xylohydrolase
MGKIIINKKSMGFTMRDEVVMIEAYGENCIRVRATRNSVLSDEKWTLLSAPSEDCVIEGDENYAKLIAGILSVEISKTWNGYRLVLCKNGKEILTTMDEGDPVSRYRHVEGDHYSVKAIFEAKDNEHFYGLGQEEQDHFDRKGCTSELVHYNTKSSMPFVYSSLGYGFLWNNPSPGRCEVTKNHTLWFSESAYQVDYLVMAGDTPADVMRTYCDLTGYAPKFPEWAAGFWQCKLRYESQEDLLEVAREYRKRNIPIDAIVIDYFHWTEQGNWEFDPELWPDPKAMCNELEEMGIRPVVSIWPTINPKSKNYEKMNEENMLVRTENGQYGIFEFYGQQTFIDVTNPNTRQYVWEQVKKTYYSYGIKTFWLDEAEPEVHPQQFRNLKFYVGNGAQTALLYPYYYAKAFYDGLKEEGEEQIVSLTRACYPGSQKFGAIVWNGDIQSTFRALRQSVVSGLSMSMCGIPWWNSDIGGFHQGDIESEYFKELIVRWFQFGVFSPVMRLHGSRKRTKNQIDRHPGVKERSGGDNEIWSFGEKNYDILKELIELRERLKLYIIKYMDIASETGKPLMRPMFFDFYNDSVCYELGDQYMFGEDILFAPIMEKGQTERTVYLPKGKWIRSLDKTIHDGGRYVVCKAELDEFIAFVKEGAEVISVFDQFDTKSSVPQDMLNEVK